MFKGELYEAQKVGAQFLCAKKQAILAWEQGTGKTIIAIASAEKLLELGYIKNVLIIAPSSIAWQWEDKINEFTDSGVTLIHAKSKELRKTYTTDTAYTITSYALFRRDFDTIREQRWDVVICDEAQEFKNNKSKTAKLLKQLNVDVNPEYRWALTGTVISNKLEELYSIMYWVDKKFFPPWPKFEERHIIRNPNTNAIIRYTALYEIATSLPKRLSRMTQKQLGDMPALVHNFYYVEKDKDLIKAEEILLECLDELADVHLNSEGNLVGHSPDVSRAFSEVKQLLAQPNKLQLARDNIATLIDENATNRVVVFSHYKQPLKDLKELLTEKGVQSYFFTGDETAEQKKESVKNFRARRSVLLCSDAGKAGLDLPFANYLFHIDIPFSYEVLDQRNKRITRASSDFVTVKANYLVVKNSFEEYYYRVVKAKERLSEAVYHGSADEVTMKTESLRKFLNDKLR